MADQRASWNEENFPFEEFQELEDRIQRAANYVVPSDDLRPRTIEQARGYAQRQQDLGQLFLSLTATLILSGLFLAMHRSLEEYAGARWMAADKDLHRRTMQVVYREHVSYAYGLVDAFIQARGIRTSDRPSTRDPISKSIR